MLEHYIIRTGWAESRQFKTLGRILKAIDNYKRGGGVGDFIEIAGYLQGGGYQTVKLFTCISAEPLVWEESKLSDLPSIYLIKKADLSTDGVLYKLEERPAFMCNLKVHSYISERFERVRLSEDSFVTKENLVMMQNQYVAKDLIM